MIFPQILFIFFLVMISQKVNGESYSWVLVTTPAVTLGWHGVTMSNNGSNAAAIVNGGYIYVGKFTNGTWTFTASISAGSRSWNQIAASQDGTYLVAVVYNGGYIYTSSDAGNTWTARATVFGMQSWTGVCSDYSGQYLAANVNMGTIYVSNNYGITWSATTAISADWTAIASNKDGSFLVAVVYGGYIYISSNRGALWTQTSAPYLSWSSIASSSSGSYLAAVVFNGYIYMSANYGATWVKSPTSVKSKYKNIAISANGQRVYATSEGGYMYFSTDFGTTFVQVSVAGVAQPYRGMASSADGLSLLAGISPGNLWSMTIVPNPTAAPSPAPTAAPTVVAPVSVSPSAAPTPEPTYDPTFNPTARPTPLPSNSPTFRPTVAPTPQPSAQVPSPIASPTLNPTEVPSAWPTPFPTAQPSVEPTRSPSANPSVRPTPSPSGSPTVLPSASPTPLPTPQPTAEPTYAPSPNPTAEPSYSACSLGTWSTGPYSPCVPCALGTYLSTVGVYYPGGNPCLAAPQGAFVANSGAHAFELCPVGSYQNYSSQSACSPCPAGAYTNGKGSISLNECFSCPPGTFSNIGDSKCHFCPKGSFNPFSGQASCPFVCDIGSSTTEIGGINGSACNFCSYPLSTINKGEASCNAINLAVSRVIVLPLIIAITVMYLWSISFVKEHWPLALDMMFPSFCETCLTLGYFLTAKFSSQGIFIAMIVMMFAPGVLFPVHLVYNKLYPSMDIYKIFPYYKTVDGQPKSCLLFFIFELPFSWAYPFQCVLQVLLAILFVFWPIVMIIFYALWFLIGMWMFIVKLFAVKQIYKHWVRRWMLDFEFGLDKRASTKDHLLKNYTTMFRSCSCCAGAADHHAGKQVTQIAADGKAKAAPSSTHHSKVILRELLNHAVCASIFLESIPQIVLKSLNSTWTNDFGPIYYASVLWSLYVCCHAVSKYGYYCLVHKPSRSVADVPASAHAFLFVHFTSYHLNHDLSSQPKHKDPSSMMKAVQASGSALKYADNSLKQGEEGHRLMLEAVKKDGLALRFCHTDRTIITKTAKMLRSSHVFRMFEEAIYGPQKEPEKFDEKEYELALQACKQNGSSLQYTAKPFRSHFDLVIESVRQSGISLKYADITLRKNREICYASIINNGLSLAFVDTELRKDKELVMAAIRQNPLALEYVDNSLQKDRAVVSLAVNGDGRALRFADESLKHDRQIVLEACRNNGNALEFVSLRFVPTYLSYEDMYDIVVTSVLQNGLALRFGSLAIKMDRDIVLAAIKSAESSEDEEVLKYADVSLRKDREIVSYAVSRSGKALKYADIELRKEKEIVMVAVQQYPSALEFAHPSMQKDREVVASAVSQDGRALQFAHESMKQDREIVLVACKNCGGAMEFASQSTGISLRNDRELALLAVERDGMALRHLDAAMRSDRAVVEAALKQNGLALQYVGDASLKRNKDIALQAVRQNGLAVEFIDETLHSDRDVVEEAVINNALALKFADATLKSDRSIAKIAVAQNGLSLEFVGKSLVEDPEIVAVAASRHSEALKFAFEDSKPFERFKAEHEVVKVEVIEMVNMI